MDIRVLRDAHFMSIADRSILSCWGVNGGKAGRPFSITVDPGGPDEHEVDALADAEPLRAGTVVRVRTTGGGGWGDPLERPVADVLRDIAWRKVSVEGARRDYGVVIDPDGAADEAATEAVRAEMRAARPETEPFFDRGPGYALLSGGATHNEFDLL
jgi:N-methylhydantoinase B